MECVLDMHEPDPSRNAGIKERIRCYLWRTSEYMFSLAEEIFDAMRKGGELDAGKCPLEYRYSDYSNTKVSIDRWNSWRESIKSYLAYANEMELSDELVERLTRTVEIMDDTEATCLQRPIAKVFAERANRDDVIKLLHEAPFGTHVQDDGTYTYTEEAEVEYARLNEKFVFVDDFFNNEPLDESPRLNIRDFGIYVEPPFPLSVYQWKCLEMLQSTLDYCYADLHVKAKKFTDDVLFLAKSRPRQKEKALESYGDDFYFFSTSEPRNNNMETIWYFYLARISHAPPGHEFQTVLFESLCDLFLRGRIVEADVTAEAAEYTVSSLQGVAHPAREKIPKTDKSLSRGNYRPSSKSWRCITFEVRAFHIHLPSYFYKSNTHNQLASTAMSGTKTACDGA